MGCILDKLDLRYKFPRIHLLAELGKMLLWITEILHLIQMQHAIKQGRGRLHNSMNTTEMHFGGSLWQLGV